MSALPDIYLNATIVNGLPTVIFPSQPYHRNVTNLVVNNGVPSAVTVYRGQLGSVPVAQNPVGNNNTLSGIIPLPAGQQLFVVWSAVGTPVSSAFARASLEKLDDSSSFTSTASGVWSIIAISQLILPTGHDTSTGPVIFLDGTTGTITVIGTGGGKILIDPNMVQPQIRFVSPDGTNNAFINAVSANPSAVDIGINSGIYTPGDGINRRGRLFMDDVVDVTDLSIIKEANQHRLGGRLTLTSTQALFGYQDQDAGVGNNSITMDGVTPCIQLNGNKVIPENEQGVTIIGQADTNVNANYQLFNGINRISVNKILGSTILKVTTVLGCFSTALTTTPRTGISIDSAAFVDQGIFVITNANEHIQFTSVRYFSGIAAGVHTVDFGWKRFGGAGTLTRDANDALTIEVREITNT